MRIAMRDSLANVEMTGEAKKIAHNTFEYRKPDGTRVVRLHQTDIIEFRPDGRIVVTSNGWQTVTTKDRLNSFLPTEYRVYSERGLWRIRSGDQSVPFQDGMILPDTFETPTAKAEKVEKAQRKLAKQISTFVAKVDKVESLPVPDSGDCWLCMAHRQKKAHDTGHLLDHVKEGYLHGTLLVNAMRWAGYENLAIHYQMNIRRTFKSSLRRYLRSQLGLPT